MRIPRAILQQNAGRECTDQKAAEFAGVGLHGPTTVEIGSGIKYGLLERPKAGSLALTDLGRQILKPQKDADEVDGLRKAALTAPVISDVYAHYRGENLPDERFLHNALTETFSIPSTKVREFLTVFLETLRLAKLLDEEGNKQRVLDVSHPGASTIGKHTVLTPSGRNAAALEDGTCFVLMPFSAPHGQYYGQIYEKAIEKAGLHPVRADAELFGTGKIIDQIWRGLNDARVLVAELTTRNPNVFYELGLAHALGKPVVLVSANEVDVPFDLRHIRVIYYDVNDPFWGQKLIEKVAENIRSALGNPEEALFKRALAAQT